MQAAPTTEDPEAVTDQSAASVVEDIKDFVLDAERLTEFGLGILAALVILVLGWLLAKFVRGRIRKPGPLTGRINPTLRPVLASGLYYLIIALTLFATLVELGVPAATLVAVFGAAGLAIGLALKDTLANVASGVMLLSLRPLDIGEYIATPDFEGTVVEIGLFATTLTNRDGVAIYVPNSKVWDGRIINYGRLPNRKFIVNIGVGYDTDLKRAVELGLESLRSHDYVLSDQFPPECYVDSFGDSAITLSYRGMVENEEYLKRASELRMHLKAALDGAGVEIPFPQRVLEIKGGLSPATP